jgi:hypothetical protein
MIVDSICCRQLGALYIVKYLYQQCLETTARQFSRYWYGRFRSLRKGFCGGRMIGPEIAELQTSSTHALTCTHAIRNALPLDLVLVICCYSWLGCWGLDVKTYYCLAMFWCAFKMINPTILYVYLPETKFTSSSILNSLCIIFCLFYRVFCHNSFVLLYNHCFLVLLLFCSGLFDVRSLYIWC